MKKWILFLVMPWIVTTILGLIVDLIFGNSISMGVYCLIFGAIFGISSGAFAPRKSALLVMSYVIINGLLNIVFDYNLPDNHFGSPLDQSVIKLIASIAAAWVYLRNQKTKPEQQLQIPDTNTPLISHHDNSRE